MIRSVDINLSESNRGKKDKLYSFISSFKTAVNFYIDILWEIKRFKGSFVEKKIVDRCLLPIGFSAKQKAACIALQIVKSQRKKFKKNKPVYRSDRMELDSRFLVFEKFENSFDF